MNIQIKQKSSYISDRRWDWSVWLAGTAAELDQIDYVTYTLHPTFPNPVREIHTRKGGFRLKSSGWGEFTIYIDIAQKDGDHYQLIHDLKLTTEPAKRAVSNTNNTSSVKSPDASATLQKAMPIIKDVGKNLFHRAFKKVAEHLPPSKVFVSGGVADAEAVNKLSESLKKLNVSILNADDIPGSVPFPIHLEDMIGQANVAVFLVSGRPSMWMNQEIEAAKRHGKHIVPVLLGSESVLPEALENFPSLHIDKLDNVASLAQDILEI